MKKAIFVFAILLALVATATSEETSKLKSKQVDTVTIAMASACDTLNPYNITGNYGDVLFDMIFDRFFEYKYDGSITPRLATRYETGKDAKGNMTMTFYLDPRASWQDGEPLTADDVVFTAQLITNPKLTTNRRFYWAPLLGTDASGVCNNVADLGIKAIDKHTVQYTFKKTLAPDALLSNEVRFQYILPEHLLEKLDPAEAHKNSYYQHPVGSGPLKFDSMIPGDRYELSRNPGYFRGTVNMDKLVIRVMPPMNYAPALVSGEIDATIGHGLGSIPLDDWAFISKQKNIVAKSDPDLTYQYMTINHQKDYFKDPRVRKAISMAINRKAIVDQLLYGQGLIGLSSLPATNPFFNKEIGKDPYDPKAALALLTAAGWDFDRALDFAVPTGNVVREKSAALIQQDLAKIGMKTKIRMVDFPTEVVQLREGKTDFGLLGGGGSADPDDVRINFNIEGSNNFSKLPNQDLYNMMDKARTLQTRAARMEAYNKWQVACFTETPYVWLYHANSLAAYRGDVFATFPTQDFAMLNWHVLEWTFK